MEWRKINGFNPIYEVSDDGNIRSVNYKRSGIVKILKPAKDGKGYLRTALTVNGKSKTIKVHRIVATEFIPNPQDKPQVNHINGIKTDNRVCNLEWCDNSYNQFHAVKNNLTTHKEGDEHHRTIHEDFMVLKIHEEWINGASKRFLAKKYNVDRNIFKRKILNGK